MSLYAVAVALFMAMSGFLLFDKLEKVVDQQKRWFIVKKQVLRIYRIYILWSIPYLIFSILRWDWTSISFTFILWQLQRWVFNTTFYTIWFMPMLAIGILFTFWIDEKLPKLFVLVLAVICWSLGSLSLTYSFIGAKIPGFNNFIALENIWLGGPRGWLFFAFPLILIGKYMVKIKNNVNFFFMGGLSCVFLIGIIVEALLIRFTSGGHSGIDLTFMMIPTVFCLLGFLIKLPINVASYGVWMRKISTLIFMTQRIFLTVLPTMFPVFYNSYVASNAYISFCAMCGATVMFSMLIFKISKYHKFFTYLY